MSPKGISERVDSTIEESLSRGGIRLAKMEQEGIFLGQ